MYYLAFAEARVRDTNIGGPRRFAATAELDREHANLRAVLAWAMESRETQVGLRLAGSLNFFWQLCGSTSEGRGWLGNLLLLPGADEPTTARAWAVLAGAWLAMLAGDLTTARGFCQEALALARRVGEPALEWIALQFSGVTHSRGDVAAAEHYLAQAVACGQAAGEPACQAASLNMLAMITCDQGDFTAARPLAEEAVRLARTAGDDLNEGWSLAWLGRAALERGALDDARAALEAGLSVARQQGQPASLTAFILNALGEVGTALGQLEQARAWLVTSIKLQHEGGERWAMTQSLERLAALAATRGHSERALRLVGAGEALYERLGTRRPPAERQNSISGSYRCARHSATRPLKPRGFRGEL